MSLFLFESRSVQTLPSDICLGGMWSTPNLALGCSSRLISSPTNRQIPCQIPCHLQSLPSTASRVQQALPPINTLQSTARLGTDVCSRCCPISTTPCVCLLSRFASLSSLPPHRSCIWYKYSTATPATGNMFFDLQSGTCEDSEVSEVV